jgi:hypothetical protein
VATPVTERRRRRMWPVLAMIGAVGVLGVLFPFEHEITPGWAFDVVDSHNRALPGCRMEEHWEWLAVGLQRDDRAVSDGAGHVRFSRRTVRASFARQWSGMLRGFGFHSAFMGPRAYFLGCAPGKYPDRLDAEKVGSEMVYRYAPGSQAQVKPLTGIVESPDSSPPPRSPAAPGR